MRAAISDHLVMPAARGGSPPRPPPCATPGRSTAARLSVGTRVARRGGVPPDRHWTSIRCGPVASATRFSFWFPTAPPRGAARRPRPRTIRRAAGRVPVRAAPAVARPAARRGARGPGGPAAPAAVGGEEGRLLLRSLRVLGLELPRGGDFFMSRRLPCASGAGVADAVSSPMAGGRLLPLSGGHRGETRGRGRA